MAHEGHAATLGSAAEKGDTSLVALELLCIVDCAIPRRFTTCAFMVLDRGQVRSESRVCLHATSEADLEQRHTSRAKVPMELSVC